jgi:hypothetical protein
MNVCGTFELAYVRVFYFCFVVETHEAARVSQMLPACSGRDEHLWRLVHHSLASREDHRHRTAQTEMEFSF